ncbi:MAG: hypothetical protein KDA90_24225, partial [Planctomycetaceae bacterium]|nr:hypothetical protein [Planctomycetaceae bacterium]
NRRGHGLTFFSCTSLEFPMEHEVAISHLRDCLGVVYLHVARTNEPAIIARYGSPEVVMVPLWEWRWLKQIEEAIRAGEIDAENWLAEQSEIERNMAG